MIEAGPEVDDKGMDAASPSPGGPARGAPRLLAHCAVLDRIAGDRALDARARVELELGGDLARLLVRALAPRRGARAASFGF
jgi:hypothetical protein